MEDADEYQDDRVYLVNERALDQLIDDPSARREAATDGEHPAVSG
jgi:hypothetical protein